MQNLVNLPEYKDCKIVNIRRGKGSGILATLVNKDGEVLISATLDYIIEALEVRLPCRE